MILNNAKINYVHINKTKALKNTCYKTASRLLHFSVSDSTRSGRARLRVFFRGLQEKKLFFYISMTVEKESAQDLLMSFVNYALMSYWQQK